MFTLVEENRCNAVIKVFGLGGGGGNAINTMIEEGLTGVEFISANTDAQALSKNLAPLKIQMGAKLTKGLGAVVTRPFSFEGATRRRQAEIGLKELRSIVDTLIVIPNEKLLLIAGKEMRFVEAFRKVDEVLYQAVRGISELVTKPGYINLDFADVKTIMSGSGVALMGTGSAAGQNRAMAAAEKAISSPLLEDVAIRGARGVLFNITAGPSLSMSEVHEAATLIQEEADEEANIIFGAVIYDEMGEELKVTVIATGFEAGVAESIWKSPRRTIKLVGREDLEKPTFLRAAQTREPERIEPPPVPETPIEDA